MCTIESAYRFSVYLFIFMTIVFGNATLPSQISKVLLFTVFVMSILLNNRTKLHQYGYYIFWNILFSSFCFLSLFWTQDREATIEDSRVVMICNLCNICVYYYLIKYRWSTSKIFRFICISCFISLFYFLATNGTSIFYDRADSTRNINDVGMMYSTAILLCIYLINKKDYSNNKFILYIFGFIFLCFILLSGSKKAIFIPLFGIGVNWILKSSGKRKIIAILCSAVIILLTYFLIMKVPFLYEIIGNRIEGLLNGLSGDSSEVDTSTKARMEMIEFALFYFSEHLYFGIGSGVIDKLIGTYAHNNYVEILSCLGLIGTIIFYSIYLYLIYNLYIIVKSTKNMLLALCMSVVTCYVFLHYGMVAYYDYFNSLMITIAAACLYNWQNNTICEK